MFFALGHLWGSLTKSHRARWLYFVLTGGFVAFAVAGAIKGDALVTILSAVVGAVTAGLAAFAPKLPIWTTVHKSNEPVDHD